MKLLACGLKHFDLAQEMDAEGKKWKFLGIQSKNRKEWYLTQLANMHNGWTTVALYDTLGDESSKFICDQTEVTSMACSADMIEKLCNLKKSDSDGKMRRVVNLITWESEIKKEMLDLCEAAGYKVYTFS